MDRLRRFGPTLLGMRRILAHWPAALGLAVAAESLLNPGPQPVAFMLLLPLLYLVIGAFRRTLRPRKVLLAQVGALAAYLILVGIASVTDPRTAQFLVAAGWIAHAGWDVWHHRHRLVVPRGYAEFCFVFDLGIGATAIYAGLTA
jgi:hypothetical protein